MMIRNKHGRNPALRKYLGALVLAGVCLLEMSAQQLPKWTSSPPGPSATETFFVGLGSAAGKDEVGAGENAQASLTASIMLYLGVDLEVQMSSSEEESMGAVKSEYSNVVKGKSSGHVSGFRIKERFTQYDSRLKQTSVWILGAFNTRELEVEKIRVTGLFAEKSASLSVPENLGFDLAKAGKPYQAVSQFVIALVAASQSGDNTKVRVQRNVGSAVQLLVPMSLSIELPKTVPPINAQWQEALKVRLVTGANSAGVPGAKVVLTWPKKSGNRMGSSSVTLVTDASGTALWTPTPIDFTGLGKVSARLDFSLEEVQLDNLSEGFATDIDPLRLAIRQIVAKAEVRGVASTSGVPLTVSLVELDGFGRPFTFHIASTSLSEALTKEGLTVIPLPLNQQASVATEWTTGTHKLSPELSQLTSVKRLVVGTARLTSTRKDAGSYISEAELQISVYELSSGSLIWAGKTQTVQLGPDSTSAEKAALAALGEAGAKSVAAAL